MLRRKGNHHSKAVYLSFRILIIFYNTYSMQTCKFNIKTFEVTTTGGETTGYGVLKPHSRNRSDCLNQCCGSGSVRIRFILVSLIRIRVAKNQRKSWKISTNINQNPKNIIHFFKNIKLMFNGHKYLTHK